MTRVDSTYKSKRVPAVRLKGKWLQSAGFAPGKYLTLLVVAPGVIELRVCPTV